MSSMGLSPIITREIFSLIRLINKEKGIAMILVEQNARMALEHQKGPMCSRMAG